MHRSQLYCLPYRFATAHQLMALLNLQYNEGKVLAVGQGRRTLTNGEIIPVAVKEGDKVLLPDYGGTQLKLDDKE